METCKKVKRRRRGKKRTTTTTTAASAAAASAFAGMPSKSGDDLSEWETEAMFSPRKQASVSQKQAFLRPVIVPKAPENSTQFLIDDHENSALFLNFENSYKSPSWCLVPAPRIARDPSDDDPFDYDPSDDEDHYCMRDFESEYQNAKEQVLLDWPRETLFAEILRLEARAHSLEQMLILQDPHNYINKLQEQLLDLQDENERLRANLRASSASTASSTQSSTHDVLDSSGISGSSDDDGFGGGEFRRRSGRRRRPDTASDLVMVVAPLSLRDSDSGTSAATVSSDGPVPVSVPPQHLHMEIA